MGDSHEIGAADSCSEPMPGGGTIDHSGSMDPGGSAGPVPATRPTTPSVPASAMYRLHRALEPNRAYRRLARGLEARPWANRWFTRGEAAVKDRLFGCRMCGQCALPVTGYACPMTCPKEIRNGPCGGVTAEGNCEVFPDTPCVWVVAIERAEAAGHGDDLDALVQPIDHRRFGESSWVNYWQGRDDDLWVAP